MLSHTQLFWYNLPKQREMKARILFFIIGGAIVPYGAFATCSVANLTRCLDSVCAINASSNPAARCQYCGTENAGTPGATGMRNVSVGASTKYTISDRELKSAPTTPSARYAWAIQQCTTRITDCTADDAADAYDKLIEQSCRAAGITAEMASLRTVAAKTVSAASCKIDISACMISDNHCTADYSACTSDADFDKFFAACSVTATGCDAHLGAVRSELVSARDTAIKNITAMVDAIAKSYQDARDKKLALARANCTDNAGRATCIKNVCERSMVNKCDNNSSEISMATSLCKFYDLACAVLK